MKIGIMAKRYNQKKLRKKKFKTDFIAHICPRIPRRAEDWLSLKIPHSITFENTYLSFPTATRFHDFMI